MKILMRFAVALLLIAGSAAAEAPVYTLVSAEDWSEGDFFRVRFVAETGVALSAETVEAIARDLVERRVRRRALHVADVRVYPVGADRSAPAPAVVVWAWAGNAQRKPSSPPGDYSGFVYRPSLGAAAAAVARELDQGGSAPQPRAPSASVTPVRVDLAPAPAVSVGRGPLDSTPPLPSGGAQPAAVPSPSAAGTGTADASLRADVLAFIARWRAAWEARDLEAYLGHYAPKFRAGEMDLDAWRAQKRRVFAAAGEIHLDLRDLEVAGEDDRATVRFVQEYRSDLKEDVGIKSLVLVKLGGKWQILREDWQAR